MPVGGKSSWTSPPVFEDNAVHAARCGAKRGFGTRQAQKGRDRNRSTYPGSVFCLHTGVRVVPHSLISCDFAMRVSQFNASRSGTTLFAIKVQGNARTISIDLNEGCFSVLLRYFPEISVFLGFFL